MQNLKNLRENLAARLISRVNKHTTPAPQPGHNKPKFLNKMDKKMKHMGEGSAENLVVKDKGAAAKGPTDKDYLDNKPATSAASTNKDYLDNKPAITPGTSSSNTATQRKTSNYQQ